MAAETNLTEVLEQLKVLNEQLKVLAGTHHPAADVILSIVPLLGVVLGSVLLFFFFLWQYKLKKERIRTGTFVPGFTKHLRSFALLIGCLSISAGLPMTMIFLMLDGKSYSMLGGIVPFSCGIGLILFYYISRQRQRDFIVLYLSCT